MRGRGKIYIIIIILLLLVTSIISEMKYIRGNQTGNTATGEFSVAGLDSQNICTYSEVENDIKYLAQNNEMANELSRLVDPLTKSNPITVSYLLDVFNIIGISEEVYSDVINVNQPHSYVRKDEFETIYNNIAEAGIILGLTRENIFIFDMSIKKNEDNLPDTTIVFDGNRHFESTADILDEYQDKMLDVYLKDNVIFKINGLGDDSIVFQNVWLEKMSDDEYTFLYNGVTKSYKAAGDIKKTEAGSLANITVCNDGIVDISVPYNLMDVQVTDANQFGLRFKDIGFVRNSEHLQVYNVAHTPYCEDSTMLLLGCRSVKAVIAEKEVQAVVVYDETAGEDIRVILSDSSYSSYEMQNIKLTCDSRFKVLYPDETENIYDGGEIISLKPEDYQAGSKVLVEPLVYNGKINMQNIAREYGTPLYYGKMEIRFFDEYMYAINVVPVENYLYSVVSSEMPSYYHEEALKAMAICARGYAYSKILDNGFDEYYADLDDSSFCQMYNNIEETPESIKAVKDTYGLVPVHNGVVIYPFSFSTSCGVTCTNEEIWGGTAYEYLKSNLQIKDKTAVDLSQEADFKHFIQNPDEYNFIEREFPYFRWKINFSDKEMSDAIMSTIDDRIEKSPDNIIISDKDGNTISDGETKAIGDIIDVRTDKRSTSGVVETLIIEGTDGSVEVNGQTNIRNIITPVKQQIIRQDDSAILGWTSLPSPYYYIEHNSGGYIIYGGGFGHGSGLSQNGAKKLAEIGYDYKDILKHYYSGISLERIYLFEDEVEDEKKGNN